MNPANLATADPATTPKPSLYKTLFSTCIGNALEWFDIIVYAFFASYIARAFFPVGDETSSLLLTFGTFGVSFLIRPLGAIVLGAYADKAGRKASLLLSIALMMVGSLMIATLPTYASIGLAAPILLLLARLIQGFSAGGEFGSSTAFLVEHFPERKAFIASWQFATQGASTVMASAFGVGLTLWMPEQQIQDWGWRIPFFFGLLIGPVGLYIRRHLHESPSFNAEPVLASPVAEIARHQKAWFFTATGLMVISTAVNYMLNYIPTYATKTLKLAGSGAYLSTLVGGIILAVLTPLAGLWAEKVGRIPLMKGALLLLLVSVYPGFYLLVQHPTANYLLLFVIWLAVLKSVYFAALPSMMADLFPASTRATGMSLSYNVAVTVFGGFAPMICTLLIQKTGSDLAPSYYLIVLSIISLSAVYVAARQHR
ncbi:MFS transporter [Neisseriaceae bacterium TC5R-5]|nr:MFS transporter [Neisseriaceae bacterium TC5R-5]